jgi:hypothetical protein
MFALFPCHGNDESGEVQDKAQVRDKVRGGGYSLIRTMLMVLGSEQNPLA